MARSGTLVTDAEFRVLEFLWSHGKTAVREIAFGIYRENTAAYHSTINSLLDQLESKGFVRRDRKGFAHQFEAAVNREQLVGMQVQLIADSHFGGAITPILLTLVGNIKLKRRDREAIIKILEELD